MNESPGYTTQLQSLLDRWAAGDESAVEGLIVHSQERLQRMARSMLAQEARLARWQQTDDLLQNALVRLHRCLTSVKPDSKRAFNRLAALQIRRELTDMARQLYGPQGHARHYHSDPAEVDPETSSGPGHEPVDPATDVVGQLEMTAFHESVDKLAEEEREVFELLYYQGMTQAEVAHVLEVSERTIKRRWRAARLALREILGENDSGDPGSRSTGEP